MQDLVRVLRIIEYVGDREHVEEAINNSIHGTKIIAASLRIKAATIGSFPEILDQQTVEGEENAR